MKINPCPMCGSTANLDSTGTSECYGKSWQTLSIECTKNLDEHCGMEMSLQADFYYTKENSETTLIEAWNKL
jgi:hypothetical protein